MRYCTVINCMDGRVQFPVLQFLQKRFNADYVDSITEPGPIAVLSKQNDVTTHHSILRGLRISIEKHYSMGIAVAGHYDCAGNPVPKEEQIVQIQKSIEFIQQLYKKIPVIGLWVDKNWIVTEISM